MSVYNWENVQPNVYEDFIAQDNRFALYYNFVYPIFMQLNNQPFSNENIYNTVSQACLSSTDAYLQNNIQQVYYIIRNTILKYRLYQDQSFQSNPP